MNKLVFVGLILILSMPLRSFTQEVFTPITFDFYINGKTKNFTKKGEIMLYQGNDTIKIGVSDSGMFLPIIDSIGCLSFLFTYKNKKMLFRSISAKKFRMNQKMKWEIGYYSKFTAAVKRKFYQIKDLDNLDYFYYWEFKPQEFGDGTMILITVPKE